MNIVVLASDEQWKELMVNTTDIQWIRAALPFSFLDYPGTDAFFILNIPETIDYSQTTKPVFINSVVFTLKELQLPEHVVRINGWNTFLNRPVWEAAGTITDEIAAVMQALNKKIITVADVPGLVAASVIAMIINEAYFALEDQVSTKAAIDTAMKLGTNYPYGPFEWAEKTGLENITALLKRLSTAESRYQPADLLIRETTLQTS
jgi:3-hydroxybutyryl-CoA dehydrogenase